jgi:hypothetical protein
MEREHQRRRRELLRQQQIADKLEVAQRAAHEVAVYENYIQVLRSVHKECSNPWNWEAIQKTAEPTEPIYSHRLERVQRQREEHHQPNWLDKIVGRASAKIEAIQARIEEATRADLLRHQEALAQYEEDLREWQNLRTIATGIRAGKPTAYLDAIRETEALQGIKDLGSTIELRVEDDQPRCIEAVLRLNGEQIIPKDSKTLLKSGKVSIKRMSSAQFYGIYQDYVCSCVLRVARELLALLPLNMVFVHAEGEIRNSTTGHQTLCTILSAAMPRATLERLNIDNIDPSDAMNNFVHQMNYSRSKGFDAVIPLKPTDFT